MTTTTAPVGNVLIDDAPITWRWVGGGESEPSITADYAAFLPADMQAVLLTDLSVVEGCNCASCGVPLGYLLAGDADEFLNWNTVVLERTTAGIRISCEYCAPDAQEVPVS